MREKTSHKSWWVAFAASLGLVVIVAQAHPPAALAGEDHVHRHRYHRMTEAEKQELEETLDAAMESVHRALEEVFDGLEIDVDLSDLDFSGFEDLHLNLEATEFDFQSEEFERALEEFAAGLSERMEALGDRIEDSSNWTWTPRRTRDRDRADIEAEIRALREKIDALEAELDENQEREHI